MIRAFFKPRFDVVESLWVAMFLTYFSYTVATLAGWVKMSDVSSIELLAVYTSYSCTWLCVGQRRINYPIGALSSALYAVLFWQSGLVASAVLNAYLLGQLVYGWFRWRADSQTRPVGHVRAIWWPVYLVGTAVTFGGAYWVSTLLGSPQSVTDSVVLVATILAQFLLDNKKIETWFVWVIVNVAAIYTYAHQGLWGAAFQFFFFLLNAGFGYYQWRKDLNAQSLHAHDSHAADHGSSAADPVR